MHINLFNPRVTLRGRQCFNPHFTGEEIEAQENQSFQRAISVLFAAVSRIVSESVLVEGPINKPPWTSVDPLISCNCKK
jgi:hypothetical protein